MLRHVFACLTLCLLFTACPPPPLPPGDTGGTAVSVIETEVEEQEVVINVTADDGKKPKNIILMIGDGMGVTQISAGLYSNGNRLNLERFPIVGLHKSYSSDNLITDSAAGATAFSAGVKSYNGAIGVDSDTNSVVTILEQAEAHDMATGLVATSSLVHATPASFAAHDPYRKNYEAIAADFLDLEIDVLIGGGKKYFDRRDTDERDLSDELKSRNYRVESFLGKDIQDLKVTTSKNFVYFTADSEPLPIAQGRDYLVPASEVATNYLSEKGGKRGFFLMIEGSQIDWGGHANNSEYIITEMLDFDRAVGKVLDFAEKDGNTLVIVTADHETGGYAIQNGSKMDSIIGAFTSDYHTADLIPVFAYGPGAKNFSGIYENTAIYDKMKMLFGF